MAAPYYGTPMIAESNMYQPMDRSLPSREVTGDSLTDAYVQFILYCNPKFSLDTDTTQLSNNFNTPPKSDSKEFETFKLWELIKQFDAKEIKTWGQLAQDLGVELPDTSKGQSVQKVQQYTVRLKRWMRAMHIDAFFEYLLAKQHSYFTDIPHPDDPYPAGGRDGVAAEEDTAIRALDPSFRPKRGRRRNSEAEQDDEADERRRQARLSGTLGMDGQAHSAYPRSAIPMSANPGQHDPWTAVSTQQPFQHWPSAQLPASHSAVTPSMPRHLQWQIPDSDVTPATPHPMTALPGGTTMNTHIDATFDNEPKSAFPGTLSTNKRKRKHGPAVSSAWPSATPTGGKPRGRPPASRTTGESPFSAFPGSRPGPQSMSPVPDAVLVTPEAMQAEMPPPLQNAPQNAMQSAGTGIRPHRLSLQVPQHTGRPVRLATPPPPMVTVNGEASVSEADGRSLSYTPETMPGPHQQNLPALAQMQGRSQDQTEQDTLTFETLKRALTTDLLRAQLIGRPQRLSGDEAKRLADTILTRLSVPRPSDCRQTSIRTQLVLLTVASWLGLGDQLNVPLGPATAGERKKITLTCFRTTEDGYEEVLSPSHNSTSQSTQAVRQVFDLTWTAQQGQCTGAFSLAGLELPNPGRDAKESEPDIHDLILSTVTQAASRLSQPFDEETFKQRAQIQRKKMSDEYSAAGGNTGAGEDGIDWKSRALALEFGSRVARGEMERYRRRVLEMVVDVLL